MAPWLLLFAGAPTPTLVVQAGHFQNVDQAVFSRDGALLATRAAGSVAVWSTRSGDQVAAFDCPTFNAERGLAFGPDGASLFVPCSGRVERPSIRGERGGPPLAATDFWIVGSGDGRWVAEESVEHQWRVSLRDGATGRAKGQVKGAGAAVFNAPGDRLLTLDESRVLVFDPATRRLLATVAGASPKGPERAYARLAAGRRVGAVSEPDGVFVFDLERGTLLRRLPFSGAQALAIADDDGVLAVGGATGVKTFELATGAERSSVSLPAGTNRVLALAFAGERLRVASAYADFWAGDAGVDVAVFDGRTGGDLVSLAGRAGAVQGLALAPDGRTLAIAAGRFLLAGTAEAEAKDPSRVRLFDLDTGRPRATLAGRGPIAIAGAHLYARGRDRAGGSDDVRELLVFDLASGARLRAMPGLAPWTLAATPDDRHLALLQLTKGGRVVDAATGAEAFRFAYDGWATGALAVSADGTRVAFRGPKDVEIREIPSGRVVMTLAAGPTARVVFSPDGRELAAATPEGNANVSFWDLASGRKLRTHRASEGALLPSYTPDGGRVVLSGTKDPTVVLDRKTGKVLRRFAERLGAPWPLGKDGRLVLVGQVGAGLRLADLDTGAELARIFSLGAEDFAVVAPDGRFDASEGGMRLVRWVIGGAPVELGATSEQRFTPGLLAEVLGRRTPLATAPAAPPKAPPLVRITAPSDGLEVDADSVELSFTLRDRGGGIADDERVFVNGKALGGDTRGAKRAGVERRVVVPLGPGRNELSVVAFASDRTESPPERVTVVRRGAVAAATLHLVLVGVSTYANANYALSFARPDAEAVAQAVERGAARIFRAIEKTTVFDTDATRANIEAALAKVATVARPEDALLFYFAGHGVLTEPGPETAAEYFLVPTDVARMYGDDRGLAEKGLSAARLRQLLTAVRAERQLVVLDACQSGAALQAFAMRGAVEERAILQLARAAGITVLSASGSGELAAEVKALGHGLFTYALLQGLAGKADGQKDGKITVRELEAWVSDEVPALTERHRGQRQLPNSFALGQDFPIVLAP